MTPVEHENRVCNQDVEAPAGEWLHGHLAAPLSSFGRRGNEILTGKHFSKTRDCQSIAGFSLFDQKP
jgi:hypothetical protein